MLNRATKVATLVVAALAITACAAFSEVEVKQEWKDNPQVLWTSLQDNWDNSLTSYTSDIFAWAYRTDYYIENVWTATENDPNPPDEEDWSYRIYRVKFTKPDWILFQYAMSKHEHVDRGSLIDKAVAYVLLYTGGTTFNYGYRDDEDVYIKFPYISNSKFKEFPIPFTMKAMMKVLMIASRNEIYVRKLDELRDLRGNSITGLIIRRTMNRFDPLISQLGSDPDVSVELVTSPAFTIDDYVLDEETGWLEMKPGAEDGPKDRIKLILKDSNAERSKGLYFEAFVNPETMMFTGLHEYENGKLVGVTQFNKLKINAEVKEEEFVEFFKGRNIGDK